MQKTKIPQYPVKCNEEQNETIGGIGVNRTQAISVPFFFFF